MKDFLYWAAAHWELIAVIAASVIQIAPFKINPWSMLFNWIGKKVNGEIITRLDKLDSRMNEQEKTINKNEKDRIRWEVLEFANSCKMGDRHTQDEYRHIIDISDKYNKIIEENNETNGYFTIEYEYIVQDYKAKCINGDFLK